MTPRSSSVMLIAIRGGVFWQNVKARAGRVELDEVAVEMGVEPVAARQDGRERVVARRERQRVFLGLARLDVNQQQFVTAAIVDQPGQDDVVSVAVHGGHRAAVAADRRGHAVVAEPVAKVLRGRTGRWGGQEAEREESRQETPSTARTSSPASRLRLSVPAAPGAFAVTPGCAQPLNFLARILALWPPKPKELFTTALTFISRAVFGT